MPYDLNDDKVLLAIDCIIKDTDKKFDECLVERFLEFITKSLNNSPDKQWIRTAGPIFTRLRYYLDHKAFVMLNQARAYKVFDSILKTKHLTSYDFPQIMSHLDSLWNTLDIIVLNNVSSAMTVMLTILERLVNLKMGFKWLIEKTIEPPVKVNRVTSCEIKDLSTLAKFYIDTSNNYHTKNKAEKLLESLIINTIDAGLSPTHPQVLAINQIVKDLTLGGSSLMLRMLLNILNVMNSNHIAVNSFVERFGIDKIMMNSLMILAEKPNVNINNICKFLALIHTSKNFRIVLNKLKTENRLEGIVVYLANASFYEDAELNQLALTYIIYPILTNCSGDDTQILLRKLLATRDERDFIDKNMNNKLVGLCLAQLNQIFEQVDFSRHYRRYSEYMSHRTSMIIMNTLINYIKCHYNSIQNYKNVMECCSVIYKLQNIYMSSEPTMLFQALQSIHSVMETIKFDSDRIKPILIELIKVLRSMHRRYTQVNFTHHKGKVRSSFMKTVDLALKFDDHDILNAFVEFFVLNRFDFYSDDQDEYVHKYVGLIWKHIYMNVKDTDHRELLGNLAPLLIEIDMELEAHDLSRYNIRRYHNIPKIFGNILSERSAILPTIELIVDALCSDCFYSDSGNESSYNVKSGYVSVLLSPTLPESIREGLDHLIKGLCITTKGEANEVTRLKTLQLINHLVQEIVTGSDNCKKILTRLLSTGILETLYDVATNNMYSFSMYVLAKSEISLIRTGVLSKLEGVEKIILDQLLLIKDCKEETLQRISIKVESIAEFYAQKIDHEEKKLPVERNKDNELELSSLVDDILHHELQSDKISECY